MIRRNWKRWLRNCAFCAAVSATGCSHVEETAPVDDRPLKIYISSPRQGGVVRAQRGEIVPYEKTKNWICTSPEGSAVLFDMLSQ